MRRMLIAGNWKMNGLADSLGFFESLSDQVSRAESDLLICPPATLVAAAARIADGSGVSIGGQDCHAAESGAHTGDISAVMLRDAGASHVIVGHSERRADHGEGDAVVKAKAEAVIAAGLVPILCVGETQAEREAGHAIDVVTGQIAASMPGSSQNRVVIAYEPVWAIGTGLTASTGDIAEMHAAIRSVLPHPDTTRILYGGSVKPANAAEILGLADVDGALVGGASLKAEDFAGIIHAAELQHQ